MPLPGPRRASCESAEETKNAKSGLQRVAFQKRKVVTVQDDEINERLDENEEHFGSRNLLCTNAASSGAGEVERFSLLIVVAEEPQNARVRTFAAVVPLSQLELGITPDVAHEQ